MPSVIAPGTIATDVVVVGGGSAGAHAALKLQAQGLDILMIVKGFLGRSGASIFAGNLQLADADDGERTEQFIEIRARYGSSYLSDQDYLRRAARYTGMVFFPEMERRGLYIRRAEDGSLLTSSDRQGGYVWAPNQGFSGTFIMELLRKEVLSRRVPLLQETMVTSLLVDNEQVVGVTALNIVTGEFLVVQAKAVILATGPSNYLATRSTGTREQCANGLAMAYRAGAEMQDMEIQWFHASDIAAPKSWMRLHLYPNPMPATDQTLRLYGSDGRMFFHQGLFPKVKQPYYLQLKSLYQQVRAGNASWTGGYHGGFTHIQPDILEYYSYQAQFFKQLGFDVTKDLIELGVTWHMTFGGVRTNTQTMETSVPGLYAAGGVGSHGVGSISNVAYDGELAAVHACERAAATGLPDLPTEQVARERQRVLSRFGTRSDCGDLRPAQIKKRIRAMMSDKMGYVKSEQGMSSGLTDLAEIKESLLPRMSVGTTTTTWNYDVVDALDVEDMLDVCELTIRSAAQRQESRGYFFREDFPFIDNANWLKHTVAKRVNGDLTFEFPSARQQYAPVSDRDDFLSADY